MDRNSGKQLRANGKPDPTGSALNRSGKIEPDKLDVAKRPKRKSKTRNRPDPADELRAGEAALDERLASRPHPPGIMLEPAGFDGEHWTSPHNDPSLWTSQLADAFGTRSRAVIHTFINQLEKLCGRNIWDEDEHQWRLDEDELCAALAMVNTVKPQNEMEAAQAAQMVAVHMMQMKLSARALKYDGDTQTAAVAGKLARTFNDQVRLQQELKGKAKTTRQSFTVEKTVKQEVHYVYVERGVGGENDGRPRERTDASPARIIDQRDPLRGQDQGRDSVSLPRSKGEK